jgi:hypothetical protein
MTEDKIVAICCPFMDRPTSHILDSLEKAVPVLQAAGWKDVFIQEQGCPYISAARAKMLRKALDINADVIVFLDYDLSFRPEDLLALIEAPDEVNAGTYRFKKDEVEYMATIKVDADNRPMVRGDGLILADKVPAGFMKITADGVRRFMRAFPELMYGDPDHYSIDLFNHGAYKGVWYGEDYAFSRRWAELGGQIWLLPNLDLNHHSSTKDFMGNFHEFMLAQPGGSNHKETA